MKRIRRKRDEPKCELFGYMPDGTLVHVQRYGLGVEARHRGQDCHNK